LRDKQTEGKTGQKSSRDAELTEIYVNVKDNTVENRAYSKQDRTQPDN